MARKIIIPLVPRTKKNSQTIARGKNGRLFIIQGKAYRQYEKDVLKIIKRQRTIDFTVNVKCLFYMPTKRRVDLTNLLEAIDDILVKAGILEDDNYKIIGAHDGSRVMFDKDNPRTEITIERLQR